MRNAAIQIVLLAFVLLGSAYAAQSDDQGIVQLVHMLSGDFDAGRHLHENRLEGIAEDKLGTWSSRAFSPMTAPAIGTHVMISSSYNRIRGEWRFDPYEFLVWTLVPILGSEDILMSPRAPLGPEAYKRSARIPNVLDGIQPGGLTTGIGGAVCPIRWSKTESGYLGTSRDCLMMSVSQRKVLNWNWTYTLKEDRLEIELAGRDKDDGRVLFGTGEGKPSVLYRLSDISEYEAARYMLENSSGPEDVSAAAALLLDVLKGNANHPQANLMLAYAQIEQGLDDEAKLYLEKAQVAQSALGKDDQSMLKDLQAQVKR